MDLRKITALVILGCAFFGLGIISFLGNKILGGIFLIAAATVVVRHSTSICKKCSNKACGFNPHRNDEVCVEQFSNLPITKTTVLPLVMTGPLAVIGAWLYSPIATVALMGIVTAAHFVFRELTCKHCGNNCIGNCNSLYKEWKAANKAAGS